MFFYEEFFFLETVATITEKTTVSSVQSNHCNRNKFFHHNHSGYQSTLSLKNGVQQVKFAQRKLLENYIFYPIANNQTLKMGPRCGEHFSLRFYYYLSYTWMDLICCTWFVFLKFPWWLVWLFSAHYLLKGTILNSVICFLLNVELFSGSSYPWLHLYVKVCDREF